MTVLLELKQKLKIFYEKNDNWIEPVLKFLLAFVLFSGINSSLGFMEKLDNIFLVLILSIICAVLPLNVMAVVGCFLIIAHCYAVGVEVAGFAILLLVILMLLFLRFSSANNVALVLTPGAFAFHIPAAVPVCGGLLGGYICAVPSCCGVILYFFMQVVKDKSTVLQGKETQVVQKLHILLDAMVKNREMWLYVLAFLTVTILVALISKCSFDYSWRIAVTVGAVVYILVMVLGGMFMEVQINMGSVIISAVVAELLGNITEFAVLGVDYSRSERTQFEDDEYVYYVKAVPKSVVAQAEKNVKSISSGEPKAEKAAEKTDEGTVPVERTVEANFDFEKQLENSLKDL